MGRLLITKFCSLYLRLLGEWLRQSIISSIKPWNDFDEGKDRYHMFLYFLWNYSILARNPEENLSL